jgi:hypothetical protein
VHHHHQRKEAEATLRQEIEDNGSHLARILEESRKTRDNMIRALRFLEDRRDGRPGDPSNLSFSFSRGSIREHRTAYCNGDWCH